MPVSKQRDSSSREPEPSMPPPIMLPTCDFNAGLLVDNSVVGAGAASSVPRVSAATAWLLHLVGSFTFLHG